MGREVDETIDVVQGTEEGITQIARRSDALDGSRVVWNFPLDITFRSTNVHGWPQVSS
jgi:B9 domain-containing protein 1